MALSAKLLTTRTRTAVAIVLTVVMFVVTLRGAFLQSCYRSSRLPFDHFFGLSYWPLVVLNVAFYTYLCWLVFSYILASFIEHQVHRKLMHRKNFLSARTASFKRIFEAHALVHHRHYAEIFSDEPVGRGEDKEIRLTVRKAPIKALPFAALIALVSWPGAAIFVAVMIFHHWAWNKLHLEMHKPERRVFSTWPVYTFLARYHCLHHRHLDRNFNVVFPLADYVLGTSARANEADLIYMKQWGL